MSAVRPDPGGRVFPLSLCHILCLCATWSQFTQARSQLDTGNYVRDALGGVGLIPSATGSVLVPSAPVQSPAGSVGPSFSVQPPVGQISSQLPLPSQPPLSLSASPTISPAPAPSSLLSIPPILSVPLTLDPKPVPSAPGTPNASLVTKSSRLDNPETSKMQSTDQGLRPIPPAATQVGDPNGHHEITEPNFSATKPCRGCSPVVEMSATGWLDGPAAEQQWASPQAIRTRVPVGPSDILISQIQSGASFVIGGSITVTPGQTVTVDNVPVAIQTTASRLEVVVGTTVVPLYSNEARSRGTRASHPPSALPPMLTIGTETITANSQDQYVVSGQTLSPGGSAIIVAGTTISLAPSATAVVVNGVTSTIVPRLGNVWTMSAPALTLNDHVYTANRAGYITISPGTVLKPGGEAITVNGTTLSLDSGGTAVVIQGSTSTMQPVTTVVTLTRSVGGDAGNAGRTNGGTWALPTKKPEVPAKPISAGGALDPGLTSTDGWLGGVLLLVWWGLGYLAVEL